MLCFWWLWSWHLSTYFPFIFSMTWKKFYFVEIKIYSFRVVVLNVWPMGQQNQHLLWMCQKSEFVGLATDPLNQKVWIWNPATCVLISLSCDSDACFSLRTIAARKVFTAYIKCLDNLKSGWSHILSFFAFSDNVILIGSFVWLECKLTLRV